MSPHLFSPLYSSPLKLYEGAIRDTTPPVFSGGSGEEDQGGSSPPPPLNLYETTLCSMCVMHFISLVLEGSGCCPMVSPHTHTNNKFLEPPCSVSLDHSTIDWARIRAAWENNKRFFPNNFTPNNCIHGPQSQLLVNRVPQMLHKHKHIPINLYKYRSDTQIK